MNFYIPPLAATQIPQKIRDVKLIQIVEVIWHPSPELHRWQGVVKDPAVKIMVPSYLRHVWLVEPMTINYQQDDKIWKGLVLISLKVTCYKENDTKHTPQFM